MPKDIPADVAYIAGVWTEGIHIIVYITLCYIFTSPAYTRGRETSSRILLVYSTVMFALSTTHAGLAVRELLDGFVYQLASTPGGPPVFYRENVFPKRKAIYIFNTLLGDSLLIWRVFVIYGRNWLVVAPSLLLLLGTMVCGLKTVAANVISEHSSVFDPSILSWVTSTFVLTIATQVLATSLIAGRIYAAARPYSYSAPLQGVQNGNDGNSGGKGAKIGISGGEVDSRQRAKYLGMVWLVAESGAVYTSAALVQLVTYLLNMNAGVIMEFMLSQLSAMVPMIIVVRVGLGLAYDGPSAFRQGARGAPFSPHHANGEKVIQLSTFQAVDGPGQVKSGNGHGGSFGSGTVGESGTESSGTRMGSKGEVVSGGERDREKKRGIVIRQPSESSFRALASFASSLLSIPSVDEDEDIRLPRALIQRGSVVLQELLELQKRGWQDEATELHYQKQRHTADTASSDLNKIWFERMKGLLCEIDDCVHCIPASDTLRFLDLGCCPGGFSSYILDKHPTATGLGISLPVTDGGHGFCMEMHHLSRFELLYGNLTYYQLGPSNTADQRLHDVPAEINRRCFDLALLDGHQLRTQTSALPWDSDRLLISQLILALTAVKPGGTIIVKLPLPHKPVAAKILHFFNRASRRLLRWKPRVMHSNRGTFYAVAQGIGEGCDEQNMAHVVLALKGLWIELTFGGEDGKGRNMVPEDLDFMVSMENLLAFHLDWLVRLGIPLWQVQAKALRGFYQRRSVV
ncbi:hypothetical protein GALMADRAFT_282221 [Galerina marginata CBS 339.88]|uniref:Ribosomal RNA methyltransferase FtsJ domain-containing protein n=1 Tax=Galerina marginata (strain CBS 339.88) TaxID=685588 RepID=A0A067SHS6_GALM3|nr:hypothetical protein GALMADRAFT_282221 [Galerina marginata CBS 339.88]